MFNTFILDKFLPKKSLMIFSPHPLPELKFLTFKSRAHNFAFRKLQLNTTYIQRIFERVAIQVSYKHLRLGGLRPCLFCSFFGGGSKIWENSLYNTCTLSDNYHLFTSVPSVSPTPMVPSSSIQRRKILYKTSSVIP